MRPWISEESSATGKTTKRKFCVLCKVMKADAKSGIDQKPEKQKKEDEVRKPRNSRESDLLT